MTFKNIWLYRRRELEKSGDIVYCEVQKYFSEQIYYKAKSCFGDFGFSIFIQALKPFLISNQTWLQWVADDN